MTPLDAPNEEVKDIVEGDGVNESNISRVQYTRMSFKTTTQRGWHGCDGENSCLYKDANTKHSPIRMSFEGYNKKRMPEML